MKKGIYLKQVNLIRYWLSAVFQFSYDLTCFQFGQQPYDTGGMPFGSQAPREYSRGSSPDWLHMQVGGGFDRKI